MNRRIFQRCLPVCLMLVSASLRAKACSTGSATITGLGVGDGNTYVVAGLNPTGQLTGYYYGSNPPHGFGYQGNVLTDLGTLGGVISQGFAINSGGQIVGASYTSGNLQLNAFLYSGSGLVDLGTLGGGYSSASLINDAGQIAGVSLLPGATDTTGFLYSQGTMTSLGTLGSYSAPFSLNNAGQVAGESALPNGDIHAFLSQPGSLLDLGTLGGNYSSAFWLNDAGTVVGESALSNSNVHAFVYSGGTMTDLGTLGGTYSSAYEINTNGQIIGIATIAGDVETHGFVYSAGVLSDLGTLGGNSITPYALNNGGQVVGVVSAADGSNRAFLWDKGQILDLNSLLPANSGWQLAVAQFINDSGRIIGTGTSNGVSATFILDLASANNPPMAVAGADQVVDCQASVTLNGSASSDPDHDPLTYEWSVSGNVLGTTPVLSVALPMGTNIVTLKVTDTCGASSKTNVTVVVADTTPPVGSCPAAASVSADANCQARVPDFTGQVTATDNCTPTQALVITQSPAPGTILGLGQHPITLTVTDSSGNASGCSVLFTVLDTTPPTILSLPSALTLSAGANCQAAVPNILAGVVASDSCTPANLLAKSQVPAAGTMVGIGVHSIQVTVTDAAGNVATGTVGLTVSDTSAPVFLSGPNPVQLSADAHCQAAVPNLLGAVLVTDNCTPAGQIALAQNPLPGTVLPVGNYTVTVTATDASGNGASLNVPLSIADTTPPVILSSPAQLTVSADASCHGQVPNVLSAIVATDNCTPSSQLSVVQSPVAGTTLPKGQSVITVTVSDAAGNSTSTSVLLSIVDTTAPTIQALSVSPAVLSPPNHQLVPVTVSALVADNCDSAPVTRITSITCNEVTAPGDIQITGNLTATLAASKSSSGSTRVYTLNIESRDASGNASTGTVTVTVPKSSSSGNGNNKLIH